MRFLIRPRYVAGLFSMLFCGVSGLAFAQGTDGADSSADGDASSDQAPAAEGAPTPPASSATGVEEASPWQFDGDVGLPKLGGDRFSLVGGADLAYQTPSWGTGGYFDFATYSTGSDTTFAGTNRTAFGVDGYYKVTTAGKYDVEAVADFDALFYSTFYDSTSPDLSSFSFRNEFSDVTRFSVLAAIRAPDSGGLQWRALFGLGLQLESYSQTQVEDNDEGGSFDDQSSFSESTVFTGRFEARYPLMTNFLALRGVGQIVLFSLTRSDFNLSDEDFDETSVSEEDFDNTTEATGLDISARVFADLESFQVWEVTPGAFVGLDYYRLDGDAGTQSTTVPVAGVALTSGY